MNPATPLLRSAAKLPRLAIAGSVYVILVDSRETGGLYAMIDAIVPPGGGPPRHVHTREDEGFYVLEGEVAFTIGGVRHVAGAGTLLHAPRNIPHTFRNESTAQARMLVWLTPGGLEQFFREVGAEIPPGAPPPPVSDAHIAQIMIRAPAYGVQILG